LPIHPQNKFCGYENSAFQAENILKNDVSPSFDKRCFCLKGNTFITAGHRPADEDVPAISLLKAELLPLYK
jgi:hypothetical protein